MRGLPDPRKLIPHQLKRTRASIKVGRGPGSIDYIGIDREVPVSITVISYDAEHLEETRYSSSDDLEFDLHPGKIHWINVDGLHDTRILEKLSKRFDIHSLVMEDIANTNNRPKFEEFESYIFFVVKMLKWQEDDGRVNSEQFSLVFGKNWVISFQEVEGDVLDYVRDRLRKTVPRERFLHSDYLAYSFVDAIVDHYYLILEKLSDNVEDLEDGLIENPEPEQLQIIYELKRHLIQIRKAIWPLREAVGAFERSDSALIEKSFKPFIRDLYEHAIQVIDSVETQRETVSGLLDIYLTSVSNRMNEVMKVLTIIATIFIPLSFLAGVYGMNFNTNASPFNMPELAFKYGYPIFWAVALIVGGGLLWYFRRKKWL